MSFLSPEFRDIPTVCEELERILGKSCNQATDILPNRLETNMVTETERGENNGYKVVFLESDAASNSLAIDELDAYCKSNNFRRSNSYSLTCVIRGNKRVYIDSAEIVS